MRVNDAVIGGVLVLFALAMIWYTRTFPAMPGQDYGPALFPVLIGIGFPDHRRHPDRERPAPGAGPSPCSAAAHGCAPART